MIVNIIQLFRHTADYKKMSYTESLRCDWIRVDNSKLRLYITPYTPLTLSVDNEDSCREQCLQQTSFLCAAYNYRDGSCELLTENNQTASVETVNGWVYAIRPNCAGIYL